MPDKMQEIWSDEERAFKLLWGTLTDQQKDVWEPPHWFAQGWRARTPVGQESTWVPIDDPIVETWKDGKMEVDLHVVVSYWPSGTGHSYRATGCRYFNGKWNGHNGPTEHHTFYDEDENIVDEAKGVTSTKIQVTHAMLPPIPPKDAS
ncbi:MAG: hypothetical protein COB36_11710 [Alphaproteobacteria bacterium]|nr:MAG: hypothetical protein COB36_11710 [Alphaproteobacteria bacterium]